MHMRETLVSARNVIAHCLQHVSSEVQVVISFCLGGERNLEAYKVTYMSWTETKTEDYSKIFLTAQVLHACMTMSS